MAWHILGSEKYFTLIPLLQNSLIALSFLIGIFVQVKIIYFWVKSGLKKWFSYIVVTILILASLLWLFLIFLLSLFSIYEYKSFNYQDEKYYYGYDGFIDLEPVVFKQINPIEMINIKDIEKEIENPNEVENLGARDFLKHALSLKHPLSREESTNGDKIFYKSIDVGKTWLQIS
ncbi:MAG: hypothetical protein Q4E50_03630 [Tissierellia bacterium]|nr:hypothetical protein [Tissierellia bacterium]